MFRSCIFFLRILRFESKHWDALPGKRSMKLPKVLCLLTCRHETQPLSGEVRDAVDQILIAIAYHRAAALLLGPRLREGIPTVAMFCDEQIAQSPFLRMICSFWMSSPTGG